MKFKQLFWAVLLLAGCTTTDPDVGPDGEQGWPDQPELPVIGGSETFSIGGDEYEVNVMGDKQPRSPKFPALQVKKGFLRGYVADLAGKPIQGAYIGARVTLIGGSYSGASAESDENGYYEINLPIGAVHYYATGYTIDYGGTRAVVGLTPADDNTSGFASETGMVKNFVLQSFGVGNKDEVLQQPGNPSNYYGGAISLDYQVDWDDNVPNYLPADGEIEIELIPEGKGFYGETKSFKVYKKIGYARAIILNIPIGRYTMKAKLRGGEELRMTASGMYANSYPKLGLKPETAIGSASVLFTPSWQVTPAMVTPHRGNWQAVVVRLERVE
ncbi:carboxypeptidase-like regulatory domain-containing protein [Dyadobacter sp. CY343]|uniref:carboxypeptidase-like regulatory domain-containing protein n=1 Tax=Dyadobacter sp. CY343 TaxID=2907299 RepID=UPI001F168011|nr:carboxypeptidase-like regulatory domain-containing protein [Dyadobacter sp. CY343]MCE7059295.1 carboxypeptidase-like regulatory domain-containing protein [Dyadobacter sp. CY343]